MKKVFLSLAVIAALTVVSCKNSDGDAAKGGDTTAVDTAKAAPADTTKAEAPVDTTKADAPKVEDKKADAPKADAKEAPKADAKKADAKKADAKGGK